MDSFNGDHEQAVVVSNDADFAEAVLYVRDGLGLRVLQVNPDPRNPSPQDLAASATYVKRLRRSHLRQSQFPDTLVDEVGTITKPTGWQAPRSLFEVIQLVDAAKIQMAGRIDADDEMRLVTGSLAERRFAAIYGRRRLVGVLGFNRLGQVMRYRMLIEAGTSFEDALAADV